MKNSYRVVNDNSYEYIKSIRSNSIQGIVTDPPYGINFKNLEWDKEYPSVDFWKECNRVLIKGGYALVFSSIKGLSKAILNLEEAEFEFVDILLWVYLNGMPKINNLGVQIDKKLNIESTAIGTHKYLNGYGDKLSDGTYTLKNKVKYKAASEIGKKYEDSGISLKPAYEPIILVKKPFNSSIVDNILTNGVGCINFTETKIENEGESRIPSNIIRTDLLEDGYDKFFYIKKCRGEGEDKRVHPTQKPIELMKHLVGLITYEEQTILDPFMGSGSTGKACISMNRSFIGIEKDKEFFSHASESLKSYLI